MNDPSRCPPAVIRLRWLAAVLAALLAAAPVAARDFTLPALDGQLYSLSDYRGQWVVVNYWATWCPPCLEELPELEVFHAENSGRAVVLGVNVEAIGDAALRRFVDRQDLSFPILVAGGSPTREQLVGRVDGIPTTYLVAPTGKPVARQVGKVTAEALNGFIERYEARQSGG
jgi:thiol-disulfide isomerase/thioredoxin